MHHVEESILLMGTKEALEAMIEPDQVSIGNRIRAAGAKSPMEVP